MTPKFAQCVDPVFLYVLGLLDRIGAGETPAPSEERVRIRNVMDQLDGQLGQGPEGQLAKYALTAWIDEVLSEAIWPGRAWWNENALEVELFNSRLANEQFYVRAKEASALARRDALEVFYVCVVLGFRGLYREPDVAVVLAEPRGLPPDLEAWAKQTALAIRLGQGRPPITQSSSPGIGAPPLYGQNPVIWSALVSIVLAAFTLIFGWITFFV